MVRTHAVYRYDTTGMCWGGAIRHIILEPNTRVSVFFLGYAQYFLLLRRFGKKREALYALYIQGNKNVTREQRKIAIWGRRLPPDFGCWIAHIGGFVRVLDAYMILLSALRNHYFRVVVEKHSKREDGPQYGHSK